MRRQVIISGVVLSLLAGCGSISQSKFNPLNWFGPSQETEVTETGERVTVLRTLAPRNGYTNFVDTRTLIPALADVQVVKSASGAIITATGLAPSLGYYDAQLVRVPSERSDQLTYEFRVRAPQTATTLGTDAQRRITAGVSLSFSEIAGIRSIIVRAANGSRVARR